MPEADPENRESKIRRAFRAMAFEIGLGVMFLGLGAQSAMIHASQAKTCSQSNVLYAAMIFDTVLFLLAALVICKGFKSLGKALMLINGVNPRGN